MVRTCVRILSEYFCDNNDNWPLISHIASKTYKSLTSKALLWNTIFQVVYLQTRSQFSTFSVFVFQNNWVKFGSVKFRITQVHKRKLHHCSAFEGLSFKQLKQERGLTLITSSIIYKQGYYALKFNSDILNHLLYEHVFLELVTVNFLFNNNSCRIEHGTVPSPQI